MVSWRNECSNEHTQILLMRVLLCLIYRYEKEASNAVAHVIVYVAKWQQALCALGRKVVRHFIYSVQILIFFGICYLSTTLFYRMGSIIMGNCLAELLRQAKSLFAVLPLPHYPTIFDSTLGYPGEGWQKSRRKKSKRKGKREWSSHFPDLSMACWNARSMTN